MTKQVYKKPFNKTWEEMGLNAPLPDYMLPYVYEVVGGKPIFRKGYQKALLNIGDGKNETMGSSSLQSVIIGEIVGLLFMCGLRNKYIIATGEHGLHLNHKDNRCLDIAIYPKNTLELSKKYSNTSPQIVIEVDIEADLETWQETEIQYYKTKTQDLLNFGVEKVIWIFTESESITVAQKENPWQIFDFKDTVGIMENCRFNLKDILKEN